MSYNAYITSLKGLKKHSNADRLMVGTCFDNQVIVGLDTEEDELGIYFPTDGKLSLEFLEANNLIAKKDPVTGERTGGYFDEKGRVRTQKFRGEKSDGFFCPLEYLKYTGVKLDSLKAGAMFTEINKHLICEKYITQATRSSTQSQGKKRKYMFKETIQYPVFHEHKDTDQLAYNWNQLKVGQVLIITSKMHGTSQRSSYSIMEKYSKFANIINFIFKKKLIKAKTSWNYICGTRRVTLKDLTRQTGYYSDESFRQTAHNNFLGKLQKGETVYYEVVGYVSENTSIMPKVNNEKLGKDFVKQYGKETVFSYGCLPGQSEVYVYRMSISNEDGFEIDYDWETVKRRCEEMAIKFVPEYIKVIYDGDEEALKTKIEELVTGSDPVGKNHIKEGVVVRIDGCKWKAFKAKSFEFKCLEGLIKDTEVVDIEEAEEIKS
jgi:hypothetical protein